MRVVVGKWKFLEPFSASPMYTLPWLWQVAESPSRRCPCFFGGSGERERESHQGIYLISAVVLPPTPPKPLSSCNVSVFFPRCFLCLPALQNLFHPNHYSASPMYILRWLLQAAGSSYSPRCLEPRQGINRRSPEFAWCRTAKTFHWLPHAHHTRRFDGSEGDLDEGWLAFRGGGLKASVTEKSPVP